MAAGGASAAGAPGGADSFLDHCSMLASAQCHSLQEQV